MFVCLNGKIVDSAEALVSVFDHGFLYGDGVYDTLRTYHGMVWQMKEHLMRLRQSAKLLLIDVPWSDEQIIGWLDTLLKKNKFQDSRIRISVTRGVNGFDFLSSKKPTLIIIAEELHEQPAEVYQRGVVTVTLPWHRLLPEAKTNNVLPYILARQPLHKKNAYEGLYVDEQGNVLEGTITNVTAIFGKTLIAPKEGILPGETQKTALLVAKKKGLEVKWEKLSLKKLLKADEIFITSTVREIIPVRMVDGEKIGTVCPGPQTKMLMNAFKEYVESVLPF